MPQLDTACDANSERRQRAKPNGPVPHDAAPKRAVLPAAPLPPVAACDTPHPTAATPLHTAIPPAAPFPIDALGADLAASARAIQARTQAPLALCAQAVLAAAAIAAQAQADVVLPDGRRRPLSLALLSVAAPGERLESVVELALRALRAEERQLHRNHPRAVAGVGVVRAYWQARRRVGAQRSAVTLARDLQDSTPEPPWPCSPVLLASDPTPRALRRCFAAGVANLGWVDAEGATALTALGRAGVARRQLTGMLAKLWDDGTVEAAADREGYFNFYGKRLSLHLTAAPGAALGRLLGGDEDRRLFGRLLGVMPASTAGTRFLDAAARRRASAAEPLLAAYDGRIVALLNAAGRAGELEPRPLPMAKAAARRWLAFHDEVEVLLAQGPAGDGLRTIMERAAEQAGRLAGVLSLFADPAAPAITAAAVEGAIALVRHYLGEAARIAGVAGESAELRAAQAVLDYIAGLGRPVVHLAEIYQGGPAATRDAGAARRALRRLEAHGYLEALPGGVVLGGMRRREAWRVLALAADADADGDESVTTAGATMTDDGAAAMTAGAAAAAAGAAMSEEGAVTTAGEATVSAAKVAQAAPAGDRRAPLDTDVAAPTGSASEAAHVAKVAKAALAAAAATGAAGGR
jgi:hypothetical protein